MNLILLERGEEQFVPQELVNQSMVEVQTIQLLLQHGIGTCISIKSSIIKLRYVIVLGLTSSLGKAYFATVVLTVLACELWL